MISFLPENELVYSLSSGDIAVVALEKSGQGVYVPSKTYYAMAAGSALLALCHQENELADLINSYHCGLIVQPDDVDGFIAALYRFKNDQEFLKSCRQNARIAARTFFSREVCTREYTNVLRRIKFGDKQHDI